MLQPACARLLKQCEEQSFQYRHPWNWHSLQHREAFDLCQIARVAIAGSLPHDLFLISRFLHDKILKSLIGCDAAASCYSAV